jgi:hypothetical protein
MNPMPRFVVLCLFAAGLAACQEPGRPATRPPSPGARASVTVYPVVVGDAPSAEVTDVVGLLLERGGLSRVEIETSPFSPAAGQEIGNQASAFGAFVAQRGLATDYALFGSFLGSPKDGVKEVRGVLVDRKGAVIWSERQKAGDEAFDEALPSCPMDCSVLLVRRLRPTLGLEDPLREGAPEGRLAAKLEEKAGRPPQAEIDAMQARLATLKAAGSKATVRICPVRTGSEWSAEGAKHLAKLINDRGLARATAVEAPIKFTAEPGSNEQRTLWSAARSIREAARGAGRSADYLLFVDCLMPPKGKAVAVHTFVVAPDGGLAIVDYQNDHHEDFTRIAPASVEACCELAAIRLASYLR